MYFKDFPQFLYDFNYGNGVTKTTVVRDITRNVRFRKEVFANITMFDEYDMVDGETPEIVAEKFYGSPEYHWIVMLANEKYDWTSDWPLREDILQKHITTTYNPKLYSDDWYWEKNAAGETLFFIKITSVEVPFEVAYLTAPVKITIRDDDSSFVHIINFPTDPIGLDETTQYFYFPMENHTEWFNAHSKPGYTSTGGVGNVQLTIETQGREHNPVMFVNADGVVVDPKDNPYAIPVTGDEIHRAENNAKRRIKIVSPKVLEMVIKNYEELLR